MNPFNELGGAIVFRPHTIPPGYAMTPALPVSAAAEERPTRRAVAKARTRQRLLGAAKQLFSERGYEAATIRDIAQAADLSTGAVFASFNDKADLFNEVIIADYESLFERMNTAPDGNGPAEAVLLDMLTIAYRVHFEQLRLIQSAIGFSWQRGPAAEKRSRAGVKLVVTKLSEVLGRGIAAGELSADINVKLTSEMLWDSYVANFRRAIFDDWDIEALRSRLAAQIRVLLAGYQQAA
jgi:AcrR family transcriptional regulator